MNVVWNFDGYTKSFFFKNTLCSEKIYLGYITFASPLEIIQEAKQDFPGEDWLNQALQWIESELNMLDGKVANLEKDENYRENRYWLDHSKEYYQGRKLVLTPLLSSKPNRETVKGQAAALLAEFGTIDTARIEAMNALQGNSAQVRAAREQYLDLAQQLGRLRNAARQVGNDWWAVQMWELLESLQTA